MLIVFSSKKLVEKFDDYLIITLYIFAVKTDFPNNCLSLFLE